MIKKRGRSLNHKIFAGLSIQSKGKTKKDLNVLFLIINIYLWIHGIGFRGTFGCGREYMIAASILLAVFSEVSCILTVYACSYDIAHGSIKENKGSIAVVLFFTANTVLRYLFYTRRKYLQNIAKCLGNLYVKLQTDRTSLNRCRVKLIIGLFVNDILNICFIVYVFNGITNAENYTYAGIPYPYSVIVNKTLSISGRWIQVFPAVTAYFFIICFVLKDILVKLTKKFENHRSSEFEYLFDIYCDVLELISKINGILTPFVSTAFAFLLTNVFFLVYVIMNGRPKLLPLCRAVGLFSHFLLICWCVSSVVEVDCNLRLTARKQLVKNHPSSTMYQYLLSTSEIFPGFKVLDSIIIDKQLILVSIGCLVTYGILIVTFEGMSKAT